MPMANSAAATTRAMAGSTSIQPRSPSTSRGQEERDGNQEIHGKVHDKPPAQPKRKVLGVHHPSRLSNLRLGLPSATSKRLVEWWLGEMIGVVAQRLHGDADQNLENLIRLVACVEEGLDLVGVEVPALTHNRLRETPQRLELPIVGRDIIANRINMM